MFKCGTVFRSVAFATTILLSGAAQAADVHVIATGAVKGAFSRLVPAFEQASGHRLIIAWGPSYGSSPDAIPTRLKNQEPVDVLIMVGAALDDRLGDGKFIAASRADLAQSGIGVGVRKGAPRPDISSPAALKQALLNAKTIGHSEGASGTYIAGTLFKKLGISEQVASKVRVVHGKELVGDVIARGEVELGLQQISELMVVPGVEYVGPLPAELQKTSLISAVAAADASQAAAAKEFLLFLASPAASTMFAQSGLIPVKPPKPE
jgi:molybdate transport system substrate-binding protein